MNEGDDTRLEDFFLKFVLQNSQELEEMLEVKLDELWNIKQESDEILMATGKTKGDDEGQVNIYVNLGQGDDNRFIARIQDLIARANEGDNYILCIGRTFKSEDVEELMQDTIFYREKCVHIVFLTIDFEEGDKDKSFNIKQEVGIRVYNKIY